MSTQPSKYLSSSVAKSRALGEPFDSGRITRFEKLYEGLAGNSYPELPEKNTSLKAFKNFAFFESYFSNYIEGTVFEVEEANQIVLTDTPIPARKEDSHDVLGTYKIVSNKAEMSICPKTAEGLIEILLYRHGILLSSRKDKYPGHFKAGITALETLNL